MTRKPVFIAFALAMCLLLAGLAAACSGTSGGGQGASDQGEVAQGLTKGLEKLAIIHTNDTHGYAQAAEDCLGMAAVAQLKKDYVAKGYEVLLLDAGDVIQGNSLVEDSKGAVAIDFMNAAGYDAMALGNHDFDYYADTTTQLAAQAKFPFLAANITVSATGELFVQPNAVFTLESGAKVGVFALDTPETQTASNPKNTAGLTFAAGEDLYTVAQRQADELRAQGCGYVVCLGHLGEEELSAPNRMADVVANTSGIDLFIDGHDHEVENAMMKNKDGNDVLVVETGCYLANIGIVTFERGTAT